MRKNSVVIKSCSYGLTIMLDPTLDFSLLLQDVADKFREAARFFGNAQMAVSFRGRNLTPDEELLLTDTICSNSRIEIVCIVQEDPEADRFYKDAVIRSLEKSREDTAAVFDGSLLMGDRLQTENSILILGDVKSGASVSAEGSVVVLGSCLGQVSAGTDGNDKAFIAALVLKPSLISIAGCSARPAITKKDDPGNYETDPKICFIRDGHMMMEELSGTAFDLIRRPDSEGDASPEDPDKEQHV